ncbi:MAG: S8 family peptidase [Polyangiaceae bacterium]
MANRPLLLLPAVVAGRRATLNRGGGAKLHTPGRERQAERLEPQFQALAEAMDQRRMALLAGAPSVIPEQVVVLVTAAPIEDFLRAVNKISGLEWLGEIDELDIPPDDDFFDLKNDQKPLSGRAYLVFSNQRALNQVLSLWHSWTAGRGLPHGFAPFKHLFDLLRDVRVWGSQDRLETTGVLDDWRERVQAGQETVRCEVELWFRHEPKRRASAATRIQGLLKKVGGKTLHRTTIEEIGYDAILVELPILEVKRVLGSGDTAFVQCDDVRLFGAVGQMAAPPSPGDPLIEGPLAAPVVGLGEPVAALLDGLPLQNHQRLRGRLDVDDPDGWEGSYPVTARVHGTGMASLILHGDLAAGGPPLARRLYVRPILQGQIPSGLAPTERAPETTLFIDLVHRAVRRIVKGDGDEGPAAPRVCVINFSIGDPWRPFDGPMSPLARLLDYLSYRYHLLFVVSAGNWSERFHIAHSGPLSSIQPRELNKLVLQAIAADARTRRLLSPAEAVNVLTVGAVHADASGPVQAPGWVDPYSAAGMPSVLNAQGMGYRRCIKPDVLMEGGRVLVDEDLGKAANGKMALRLYKHTRPPGLRVAAPGTRPGETSGVVHTRGTSGATALVTRAAIQAHDVVVGLRNEVGGAIIDAVPMATWIRTLLVHAAQWSMVDEVTEVLRTPDRADRFREYVTRLLGYGRVDPDRLAMSTDHRVTALGGGVLSVDQSHIHRFPLPPSLSGKTGWRRLTLTLSYFSPINARHLGWRRAHLWFEPPKQGLTVKRTQADYHAVTRGTVQHEMLEGEKADVFVDGDALLIQVSCRASAGSLEEPIPYAIAITLEIAENIGVPIYEEIAQRLRAIVRVQSSG